MSLLAPSASLLRRSLFAAAAMIAASSAVVGATTLSAFLLIDHALGAVRSSGSETQESSSVRAGVASVPKAQRARPAKASTPAPDPTDTSS